MKQDDESKSIRHCRSAQIMLPVSLVVQPLPLNLTGASTVMKVSREAFEPKWHLFGQNAFLIVLQMCQEAFLTSRASMSKEYKLAVIPALNLTSTIEELVENFKARVTNAAALSNLCPLFRPLEADSCPDTASLSSQGFESPSNDRHSQPYMQQRRNTISHGHSHRLKPPTPLTVTATTSLATLRAQSFRHRLMDTSCRDSPTVTI